jgi:hypothetical protein
LLGDPSTAVLACDRALELVVEPMGHTSPAPLRRHAAVAQLVERKLPKLEVAGSTPVRRLKRQSEIWL